MQNEYLAHFGVKGMKWGVWNNETRRKRMGGSGASRKTKRMAKKDAKEYATAKMYYGEGAGNRRKLIKNQVEQRKKDRPGYAEEFEKRLSGTNWDKTVSKAKTQRAKNTAVAKTKQTARGVTHVLAGNPMYASAAAIALVGALKVTGMDKKVVDAGKKAADTVIGNAKSAAIFVKMASEQRKR